MGTTRKTMKVLIIVGLLILSVSTAPKGKGKGSGENGSSEKESGEIGPAVEGVILTHVEVSLACTKGTPLGEKLEKAFNDCNGDGIEVRSLSRQGGKRKGGKGKGKAGKGKGKAGKGKSWKRKGKRVM